MREVLVELLGQIVSSPDLGKLVLLQWITHSHNFSLCFSPISSEYISVSCPFLFDPFSPENEECMCWIREPLCLYSDDDEEEEDNDEVDDGEPLRPSFELEQPWRSQALSLSGHGCRKL